MRAVSEGPLINIPVSQQKLPDIFAFQRGVTDEMGALKEGSGESISRIYALRQVNCILRPQSLLQSNSPVSSSASVLPVTIVPLLAMSSVFAPSFPI